jgi:S-DNA-T family DNA segregation ATPase FtsK/SpoIIIE
VTKQEENLVYLMIKAARRAWWSRPGYEAIGKVFDTFEALGFETRSGMKPVLAHKHRTAAGWHLVWQLPPGISSQDITAKLMHFEEQVGGSIILESKGPKLHMNVTTTELPRKVAFDCEVSQQNSLYLPVPIGVGVTGPVVIDLASLPHMLIGGNTGGGKTTFLRVATVSLMQRGDVFPVVIDLKGLDFAYLRDRALLIDTEQGASSVLAALNREMDRRRKILQAAGATKLPEYHGNDLPWIVCIVDELAELTNKEDQAALNRLGRLARAVGISLMVATQRPSHTLFNRFSDLRMLFAGRLMFTVPKPEDSRLLLDSESACRLPADIPGRAIWRWSREQEVQCYNLSMSAARRMLSSTPVREGGQWYEQRPQRLLT